MSRRPNTFVGGLGGIKRARTQTSTLANISEDVVDIFAFDPLWEIERKYPESKPVCLNYATTREDILDLCGQVRKLRFKVFCMENLTRKIKIGRWTISIRKDVDVHDKTGDIEVA